MRFLRTFFRKHPSLIFGVVFFVASFLCRISLPGFDFSTIVYAADAPNAADLDKLMSKLLDSTLSEIEKERITAVIFFHTQTSRSAVLRGKFPADSPQVQAFLKYKQKLQVDVIQRMGINYKNKFGTTLRQPIIPFGYNNILSDDDIITGTGKQGRVLESQYNEALSEIMQERAGRPMTAADRARVDVNGLAWNMTQDGAFEDFHHKEKYINPQSGFANQQKLIEGAQEGKVTAYTFDEQGRLVKMDANQTVEAINRLAVDRPLEIPGIDSTKGTGSMSDFLRMAQMHQVKFLDGKAVTDVDIIQFIRNQKYSQRVIGPFQEIGAMVDPEAAKKYASFMQVSDALRAQTTTKGVAQLLEGEYKVKIIDPNGIIDYQKLGEAMRIHQTIQLAEALPTMMGAVSKSEIYKISKWLSTAGAGDRLTLRKQLALTYAPLTDGQRATILSQVDMTDIPDGDKAFVRQALDGDAKQIRRYAELMELKTHTLTGQLRLNGDNHDIVEFLAGEDAKVRRLCDSIKSRPGGSRFNEFLKSKTAKALNLDVMLDFSGENKGQKFMQWSMILLAATRAYQGATDEKEGLKQMGTAVFQMIPFVASALRFSEDEFRLAFKEFAMDIFPPLALANLAFMFMDYTAQQAKGSWDETVWDGLAREALRELGDDDFEKTDMEYYRLKEREAYFEYIKDVAPGFGRVAKLASMVAPEVEALLSRNEEIKVNMAALHALQWFEKFDEESQSTYWAKQFDIQQLKNRVWNEGHLGRGSASPVERVAAKILLDNIAIRLEMQNKVLSKFIDRIEKRYNDLKGELSEDCTPQGMVGETIDAAASTVADLGVPGGEALEWITGAGEEQKCDPNAIVMETMAVLKSLYENAPAEVRDSQWALETLEEEYSRILGYLQDYAPEGKPELDIRKEMQEIIDGFKLFIQDLVFGVALYEEAQTLNLAVHLYGGDDEYDETDKLLLGDSFRLGASARVSPMHSRDNWQVFYYAAGPLDMSIKLIGSAKLNPNKYNPGAEGLWIIEDPDKDTILHKRRGDIMEEFDIEGPYQFVAVLAFGNWSDPVGQVGYAALRNPIEHAQSFTPEKVAFASTALDATVVRARLSAKPEKPFYPSNETPEISYYLEAPEYASRKRIKAQFSASAAEEGEDEPQCYPPESDEVSFNSEQPSVFNIVVPPDAKDGQYFVDIAAEIQGFAPEYQPFPQAITFRHLKKEGEGEGEADQGNQMSDLESLRDRSQALLDKASSTYDMLNNEVSDAIKTLNSLDKDLKSIDKLIKTVDKKAGAVDSNLALTRKDADQAQIESEKAAANREEVQNHALGCCSAAEQVKQNTDVERLKDLIEDVRLEDDETRSYQKSFKVNLRTARLAKNEAEEIKDTMLLLRGSRAEIVSTLAQIESVLNVVTGDVERLKQLSATISEAAAELATVRVQADAILNGMTAVNQKKKLAKTITRDDTAFLKTATGIVRTIGSNEKQAVKFDENGKKKISKPSSQLEDTVKEHIRIKESANKLIELPEVSDETFAKFEKNAKDAQVAYDSAEIFEDSVNSSAQQSSVCLDAAQKHFARETSPEAQVAKKDCAPWLGTSAQWNAKKKLAECQCPKGDVWDEGNNRCTSKKDYEWARTNCDNAPGTQKVWNAKKQVVECHCPQNQFWNGSRCEARKQWQPNNQGGNNQGAQDLLKGLQDLMKAAQGGGVTGGGTTGGTGGNTGGSSGGSSGGSTGSSGEQCAAPGRWDGTCCRCPDGHCELWGQGCAYWDN